MFLVIHEPHERIRAGAGDISEPSGLKNCLLNFNRKKRLVLNYTN